MRHQQSRHKAQRGGIEQHRDSDRKVKLKVSHSSLSRPSSKTEAWTCRASTPEIRRWVASGSARSGGKATNRQN